MPASRKEKKLKEETAVPAEIKSAFPIIGIGASAGGLETFEKFFTHLPPDSGMAFVIVQHLDPTHESILTDLLRKYTRMPVVQVADQMLVEPNHVFVIPPNHDMALLNGKLHLMTPTMPRGLRLPIDFFFRSLAADQKEQAICIILSGTGTDGTLGLKAIKEEGGLTIVQAPDTARYDGMPVSAINTGLVDVILPPEKIAEQLIDYVQRSFRREPQSNQTYSFGISDYLQKIYILLRDHTGHDFSGYKENTISRRVERRMTINQIAQIEDYLRYLQFTPLEIDALFRELLIGVTSFFRDPEAFDQLKQKVIIPLFSQPRENPKLIRVWVPGCSTGEEAYSIAMLLLEQKEKMQQNIDVQVFASDIDQLAINKAREGRYPDSIAADVTSDRLQRFFIKEKDSNLYQINRQLRDMVVFAPQSLIKDPPFSKLDLICCRNVMIYLGAELQQKILPLFHYALIPGGYLFLGNSETLGSSQRLFHTIDSKWKIYQRAEITPDFKTVLSFPAPHSYSRESNLTAPASDKQINIRDVMEQMLLADYTPTSIVINEKGDMLYVHGRTGKFLEQTTGEASTNILKVARQGLRMPLAAALRNVITHKKPHTIEGISVGNDGDMIRVKLSIVPILKPAAFQGLILIVFSELTPPIPMPEADDGEHLQNESAQHVLELEQELRSTREYLQTTIEELETTNEELKSSNEELLSSNEELQSTNEELQTSKEELQSVNEELTTLNGELQNKIDELTAANNDIKNLLNNTNLAIIFLDMSLRIRRYTPSATEIVDLIPADIGRQLGQFVHKLKYDRLTQDVREVLDTLNSKEIEIEAHDGRFLLLRILPYSTVDNYIDGVVLNFLDVTQLKKAKEEADQFARFPHENPNPVMRVTAEGCILYANQASTLLFDEWQTQVGGAVPEDWQILVKQSYKTGKKEQLECEIQARTFSFICVPVAPSGYVNIYGYDISDRKQAEMALEESEMRLRMAKDAAQLGIHDYDILNDTILWDERIREVWGVAPDLEISYDVFMAGVHPEDRDATQAAVNSALDPQGDGEFNAEYRVINQKDQREHWVAVTGQTIFDQGRAVRLIGTVQDITERKRAEAQIITDNEKLQLLFDILPVGVSVLDQNQNMVRKNAMLEKILEMSEEDLLKGNYHNHQYLRSDGSPMPPEEFASNRVKDGESTALNVETGIVKEDGHTTWVSVSATTSPYPDWGTIVVTSDITQQKQAEEALHQHELRLRRLFDSSLIGFITQDTSGTILDANDAFLEMIGYSRSELSEGSLIARDLTPTEFHGLDQKCSDEVSAQGYCQPYEKEFFRKDGMRIPVLIGYSLFEGTQKEWIGYVLDLRALKQAKSELIAYAEKLKHSNEALENFAFMASHDLQEPLRKILAFGNRLRDQLETQPTDETAEYLNRMQNAAERMQTMINGLLDLSRVETQGKEFEIVSLTDIAQQVVEDLNSLIASTEGQVYVEPLPSVNGDGAQLRQLIQNLVSNALKYHQEGVPPVVKVTGEVVSKGKTQQVRIEVADNGIGFEEAQAEKLFQPFIRLHGRKYDGSGLGLAICRKIAERHGGSITVQSEPGQGSRFIVTLEPSAKE